ncbi:MAG: 4Fe-4S binding protein [Rhodoferax sp.]
MSARTQALGEWLRQHGALVRRVQWTLAALYLALLAVPPLLELPDETAHVFNHLTVFAQWLFWGIWWPFVLLSMVVMGRVWCGVLCPEGFLSEWASRHGRNHAIPHWVRWQGWPFVAFAGTTVYGQMVSVYQYPKAVLLVLGGSTVAAMAIGYWYGREKRVWCRYLCPVSGVFGLLAKLAPWHFRVDAQAWRASYGGGAHRVIPINCAPLVAIRKMEGASDCHMCARCSGHRDAVSLQPRSPQHEVVALGATHGSGWQTVLLLYGMLGLALGAFQWSVNPAWVQAKQGLAEWLVEREIWWPLAENAPWWVLTHYPAQRDVLSWLDGALLLGYVGLVALVVGSTLAAGAAAGARTLGAWQRTRFYHLAQAYIPLAACSLFLGLSALTLSLMHAEGLDTDWALPARSVLLALANAWCLALAWGIAAGYGARRWHRALVLLLLLPGMALVDAAWWWQWTVW